jgi:hypothetical protein
MILSRINFEATKMISSRFNFDATGQYINLNFKVSSEISILRVVPKTGFLTNIKIIDISGRSRRPDPAYLLLPIMSLANPETTVRRINNKPAVREAQQI